MASVRPPVKQLHKSAPSWTTAVEHQILKADSLNAGACFRAVGMVAQPFTDRRSLVQSRGPSLRRGHQLWRRRVDHRTGSDFLAEALVFPQGMVNTVGASVHRAPAFVLG